MALMCPRCGAANGDAAKFCKSCGLGLSPAMGSVESPAVTGDATPAMAAPESPLSPVATGPTCGSCGLINNPQARFCRSCGALLPVFTGASAANAPSAVPVAASVAATVAAPATHPTSTFSARPADPVPTALPFPVVADTSKSPLWIVLIAGLLVLALGGGAYWYVQNRGMPAFGSLVGRDDVPTTATDVAVDAAKDEEIITEAAEAADDTMTEAEADVATDRAGPAETQAAPAPTITAVPRPVERPVAVAPPAPLPPKPIPTPRPAPSVEQKPVLKFTPIDPQTARNLPPPPGGYVAAPPVNTASPGLPAVRVPSAGAGPASPEEACGRRVFLAMTMCIARQCETPQFTSHPQCVQLRQQEKARQEQNSLRN